MGRVKVGRLAGIGVYLHWSFFLVVVLVLVQTAGPILKEQGWTAAAIAAALRPFGMGLLVMGALFVCVLLHEMGHALAARRYGVQTRDITLFIFGGVARLERIPERPVHELVIALAGPTVNLVIAGLLLGVMQLLPEPLLDAGARTGRFPMAQNLSGFLAIVVYMNVFLLVFNLIPALPMDGGRVLRSILAMWLNYATATRIAAAVGQIAAIGFVVVGIMSGNLVLIFIGALVFLAAQSEARMAQLRGGLSGIPVRDAMATNFVTLSADDTLQRASEALLAGTQQDFPVLAAGGTGTAGFIGVLSRDALMSALTERGLDGRVGDIAAKDCPVVSEYDMLFRVVQRMQESGSPIAAVVRPPGGQLVGLVTGDNIEELMMIRSALRQRPARRPVPRPLTS
jgi:Zn-dependent protease